MRTDLVGVDLEIKNKKVISCVLGFIITSNKCISKTKDCQLVACE